MARNKKSEIPNKTAENSLTKVFLLDKSLLIEDNELISIELPRKKSMFLKSKEGVYELIQFNENNRCFFIDNTVCCDGKFYISTRFDPLFAFVQFLEEKCKTKAQPLDQIIEGNATIFLDVLKMQQMKMIADQKGPEDLKAFLYNEEKVMKWLKIKFERIQESLKQQKIINSGSSSMNFVKSSLDHNETENEDEIASTALGIISEYISLNLYEKLDNFYGISEKSKEPISQKRKSNANEKEPDSKKIKSEPEVLKEITSPKPQANIKTSKNAVKLEKAAKGSKSISSFFTKK